MTTRERSSSESAARAPGLRQPGDRAAGYMTGQCLVAMPGLIDSHFSRTVIYLCAHTAEGAMGLVINRPIVQVTFNDVLEQIGVEPNPDCDDIRVHFGGPVETGRGFVLHTTDFRQPATMAVDDAIALTATTDVLKAIAGGYGPRASLLVLGYAGWNAGQLDAEIKDNAWLTVDADEDLLFGPYAEHKWEQAIHKLGIDPAMLSDAAGHA
nr:YqgE/AlgH family protein [Novispirillum itersonii]